MFPQLWDWVADFIENLIKLIFSSIKNLYTNLFVSVEFIKLSGTYTSITAVKNPHPLGIYVSGWLIIYAIWLRALASLYQRLTVPVLCFLVIVVFWCVSLFVATYSMQIYTAFKVVQHTLQRVIWMNAQCPHHTEVDWRSKEKLTLTVKGKKEE